MDPEILREVYRHAPLPWTLLSLDGRVLAVNPAACEFFGRDEDEVVGVLAPAAARPDSPRHTTTRALIAHLLDGTIDRYEDLKRFVRKDGSEVWARITCTLVRDADDNPRYFMSLWVDVTAQKAAEDALRLSEQRFIAAFEHAPIGMAITDLAGVVLQANPAMGTMAPAAVDEKCALLRLEPADLRRLVDKVEPFIRHEVAYAATVGAPRWAETTASLVRRSDGVPLYLMWQVEDVTDRRRTADELAWRATHDHLTGLANRAVLRERLTRSLARREGGVAVLFCDLDGLKGVNDRFGHEAGDRLLVAVATRLITTLRPTDTVARLGGDEMVVLCEDVEEHEAIEIGARVLDAVTAAALESVAVPVTASIGLAVAPVGADAEALLHDADAAMYRAKSAGGNRTERAQTAS